MMARRAVVVLFVLAMVAAVVGVDFAFFKHRFLQRLLVNVGIVVAFIWFYSRLVKRA